MQLPAIANIFIRNFNKTSNTQGSKIQGSFFKLRRSTLNLLTATLEYIRGGIAISPQKPKLKKTPGVYNILYFPIFLQNFERLFIPVFSFNKCLQLQSWKNKP